MSKKKTDDVVSQTDFAYFDEKQFLKNFDFLRELKKQRIDVQLKHKILIFDREFEHGEMKKTKNEQFLMTEHIITLPVFETDKQRVYTSSLIESAFCIFGVEGHFPVRIISIMMKICSISCWFK